MKIAELFVNLGVKGNDTAKNALKGTRDGLSEVKSMGLETKAAIAAVVYGLERMMSGAARAGTDLRNLADYTGESTKFFQQWEYGARRAGIASQEADGSIKSIQGTMQKMLMGLGAPSGFAAVANSVGLDKNKLGDVKYVIGQLREFAKSVPPQIGNEMLKSFGLSENVIAGMRRGAFDENVLSKAPIRSDSQLKALNKVDGAWRELGYQIDNAFSKFTAKNGLKIVNDLSTITKAVIDLVGALTDLGDRMKVLQTLGSGLTGIANSLKLIAEVADMFGGKASKKGDLLYVKPGESAVPGFADSPIGKLFNGLFNNSGAVPNAAVPNNIPLPWGGKLDKPITINQTNQFQHDGTDPRKTSDSHEKAAVRAYRSMSAQVVNN